MIVFVYVAYSSNFGFFLIYCFSLVAGILVVCSVVWFFFFFNYSIKKDLDLPCLHKSCLFYFYLKQNN